MKVFHKKVSDMVANKEEPPLPLAAIPKCMGISLRAVDSLSWTRQHDGQLVSLTVHFIPSLKENPERRDEPA
jgi:hypothetical protein